MRLNYYVPIFTWSILILLLLYQVIIPPQTVSAKGESESGTIAGIEIAGKKKLEIQSLLASEVMKWKEGDIVVQGTTATIVIPSDAIKFDIKKTVDYYISVTSKPWYNFWSGRKKIQIPIEVSLDESSDELLKDAPLFLVDETIAAIKDHAGFLRRGSVQAEEVALSKDLMKRVSFEIQDITVNENGISQIIEAINDTAILNGEQFSFLDKLKEANSHYNDDAANFVASTLYSAVLQSELTIRERYSQNVQPNYLLPGVEVKVDKKRNQDFSFVNLTNRPIIISASLKEGRLLIELYSFKSDYEITYEVRNEEIVGPRTIYRLTSDLPAGQEKEVEKGEDGLRVQVYKKVKETNGSYEIEQLISQDFYPPINKVILVSSLEPS